MLLYVVNERYACGGAEEIARSEVKILRAHGHDAVLITLDGDQPACDEPEWVNVPLHLAHAKKLLLKMGWSERFVRSMQTMFESRGIPDAIHIHNVHNGFLGVVGAIERVKDDARHLGCPAPIAFQTIHDYSAVCPRSWCTDLSDETCAGYRLCGCVTTCHLSLQDRARLMLLRKHNAARNSAFSCCVTPSEALTQRLRMNGVPAQTVWNPFDASGYQLLSPEEKEPKSFLYFGRIGERKGVFPLLDAWGVFISEHYDATLTFVGKVEDDVQREFERRVSSLPGVMHLDACGHDEMMERVRRAWCVVVPSLWMETSPNVVREALCLGTLVIGSNRGGIPEMVDDDKLLFDIRNVDAIVATLDYAYKLDAETYRASVLAMKRVLDVRHDPQGYCESILKIISSQCDEKSEDFDVSAR